MIDGREQLNFDAEYRLEMLNLIRRDKFRFIMPEAMRKNGVDMWIHVTRRGGNDPFSIDFGASHGCFIFTDTGDKIEKALFGFDYASVADPDIYDILGDEEEIGAYVEKHNPKVIGVNISEKLTHFDSLSHYGYIRLCDYIGEENAAKIVSAEDVITSFRARRVNSEIAFYGRLCEIQRRIVEKGLRSIVAGKTTKREMALYGHNELISWGLKPNDFQLFCPEVVHSCVSSEEEVEDDDYVYQKGDLIFWDWGYERVNLNYGVDFKRNAYLLKDGEKELPDCIRKGWSNILKARTILKDVVRSGETAGRTVDLIVEAMEEAGFIHTPFENCPEEVAEALGENEKPGFSIDFHTVGNAGTDYEVGSSIAPQRKDRADLVIPENQLISFEFMINQWAPEWKMRALFDYEENVAVTPLGCQFLYPRSEEIILIG